LKERGFYYFGPDYLLVQVDSTEGDNQVEMRVVVKPETPSVAGEIFEINDVYIYSNYSLNTTSVDTSKAFAEFYEGYYLIDKDKMYKPRLFEQTMQFRPGEVYNRTDHNQTLNRLINLNLFKFVKNRFEPVAWLDSPRLDAYYYLTPLPKKSIRAEIGTTNKSNGLTGSQLSVSWHNRNTFRAGQQLHITAFVGSEVQYNDSLKGFNTFRLGAEATLSYPRIVSPFFDFRVKSAYVPRTNITLGYEALNKAKLYTLNSFRFSYGYLWRESIVKQHEFNPISINYVQPFKVSDIYQKQMLQDATLAKAIEEQFVLGTTYQYTFNELLLPVQKTHSYYFNGLVDLSGNVAGLLTGASRENRKQLFNAYFSQYVKLEAEGRYYWKLLDNLTWANRLIMGYGLPYGNSTELPFIKQFFVGGNNSIRAFRSRSVGPGTYLPVNTTSILPDQAGDIKFEVNTELRPRISGPLYGAIFLDAGNVWLKSPDSITKKPGAQFTKDFIKQLGIGTGIGLRFDITLFVIRLDVAFPLHKPWEDNPWVMNQIRFNEPRWRRQNIVYNLAIGYPF
jgi:outer membrane protein insertion porin family